MTVKVRRRRSKTAKENAARFNMSERTVRRYIAEYRSDYEARAAERRELATRLRETGKTWAEVGDAMGCTARAARSLGLRHRQQARPDLTARDPHTRELFV